MKVQHDKARKPFVLPQEDPDYYENCIPCFSVPELLTGLVTIPEKELAAAVVGTDAIKAPLPITTAHRRPGRYHLEHPNRWSGNEDRIRALRIFLVRGVVSFDNKDC